MADMNRRVAEALDLPPLLLVVGVYLGFAVLAIGGIAKVAALGYVAMLLGVGLTAVGLRAAIRPTRSFDTGTPSLQRLLGTSRAVGAFYRSDSAAPIGVGTACAHLALDRVPVPAARR